MKYDEVVAAAFQPSPSGVEVPTSGSLARRLRDAIEPLAMHAVWSRQVNERLESLGLDFLSGYVWGRAAALGEPDPQVVASTFAWFEPSAIGAAYDAGRSVCSRSDVLAARATAADSLEAVLADEDVERSAWRLRHVVEELNPIGRPLFAGLQAQPWPASAPGQLWRACELLREHRGDAHTLVCVSEGLDPVEMNVLTEAWLGMPLGSYSATRAWSAAALASAIARLESSGLLANGAITPAGRARRDAIEANTDALEADVARGLGDDAEELIARLEAWSSACIAARAFPPNVFKRAAG